MTTFQAVDYVLYVLILMSVCASVFAVCPPPADVGYPDSCSTDHHHHHH